MASEGGAARRLAGRRGFVRRIHDERSVRYGVGCDSNPLEPLVFMRLCPSLMGVEISVSGLRLSGNRWLRRRCARVRHCCR